MVWGIQNGKLQPQGNTMFPGRNVLTRDTFNKEAAENFMVLRRKRWLEHA